MLWKNWQNFLLQINDNTVHHQGNQNMMEKYYSFVFFFVCSYILWGLQSCFFPIHGVDSIPSSSLQAILTCHQQRQMFDIYMFMRVGILLLWRCYLINHSKHWHMRSWESEFHLSLIVFCSELTHNINWFLMSMLPLLSCKMDVGVVISALAIKLKVCVLLGVLIKRFGLSGTGRMLQDIIFYILLTAT